MAADTLVLGIGNVLWADEGFGVRAVEALNAGCDMVLLCNQSLDGGRAVDELIAGLERAWGAGRVKSQPAAEARRLALLPQTAPLAWDELMHDALYRRALDRLP
mgnify:CR=1 FL=1